MCNIIRNAEEKKQENYQDMKKQKKEFYNKELLS